MDKVTISGPTKCFDFKQELTLTMKKNINKKKQIRPANGLGFKQDFPQRVLTLNEFHRL